MIFHLNTAPGNRRGCVNICQNVLKEEILYFSLSCQQLEGTNGTLEWKKLKCFATADNLMLITHLWLNVTVAQIGFIEDAKGFQRR